MMVLTYTVAHADLDALRNKNLLFGGDINAKGVVNICEMSVLHRHIGAPYVLLFGFNENWGGMSTELPCESTTWGLFAKYTARQGCTMKSMMA